ncbi:hypothetical protein CEXT_634641 [Caerostris extrusa]|uniref:Uncharacterized protein n=1 Tax=Caerostris extrusa TaxID=172846 RepID=A0AAV4RVZ7_CAEEX|nr:hypothetical protein CEXT_634641 [Caerostris extrusa]
MGGKNSKLLRSWHGLLPAHGYSSLKDFMTASTVLEITSFSCPYRACASTPDEVQGRQRKKGEREKMNSTRPT